MEEVMVYHLFDLHTRKEHFHHQVILCLVEL